LTCSHGFIHIIFLEKSWAFTSGEALCVSQGDWGGGGGVKHSVELFACWYITRFHYCGQFI
jgi:hypothetical protein